MKIVIWLQDFNQNQAEGNGAFLNPALQVLGKLYGDITLIGLIAPPEIGLANLRKIDKEEVKNLDYDLILVTCGEIPITKNAQSNFVKVLKEAKTLGIDEDKIVLDRVVVCIPNFTLEKNKKLRHSQLSILSMNCFGGLCYHRFGLPFLSPIINMYTSEEDFLKLLKDPKNILNQPLIYQRQEFDKGMKTYFPVFKIGEVEWYMNHYSDIDDAFKKWNDRSSRINWNNLLVMMYTENPKILAEFDKLPYSKKVCFVPFKSDLDSAYCIDISKYQADFSLIVNNIARGWILECDMWDLLLYGKKTKLNF